MRGSGRPRSASASRSRSPRWRSMRYACGDHAEEVLLGGRTYRGADAITRGLAHRVVADDLVEAAVAEASDLGGIPVEAYRDTKAQLRAPAVARIRQGGPTDRRSPPAVGRRRDAAAHRCLRRESSTPRLITRRARRRRGCAGACGASPCRSDGGYAIRSAGSSSVSSASSVVALRLRALTLPRPRRFRR